MRKQLALFVSCAVLVGCESTPVEATTAVASPTMDLGAFSVSLAVKDLATSREFYRKLGFEPAGGDGKKWQILRNGGHVIGLFQGMFPKNILTFNPGWTQQATPVGKFTDVREIQERLKKSGLALTSEADAGSAGPASLMLVDPDGNPVLIDQHVPKPK